MFNFALPSLLPGSPLARLAGEEAGSLTKEEKQRVLATYALDRPVIEQFFNYVKAIVSGDLGVSFSKKNANNPRAFSCGALDIIAFGFGVTPVAGRRFLLGRLLGSLAPEENGYAVDVGNVGVRLLSGILGGPGTACRLRHVFSLAGPSTGRIQCGAATPARSATLIYSGISYCPRLPCRLVQYRCFLQPCVPVFYK